MTQETRALGMTGRRFKAEVHFPRGLSTRQGDANTSREAIEFVARTSDVFEDSYTATIQDCGVAPSKVVWHGTIAQARIQTGVIAAQ